MRLLRLLLPFWVALLMAVPVLHAQVEDEEPEEEPFDVEAATPDVPKINADSLDSIKSNVPHRVLQLTWDALIRDTRYAEEIRFNLASQVYADVLDRLPGFSQTLGQMGKPYRRYLYGFHSAWQEPTGLYLNPVTREEEAYLTDPDEGLRLLDSRTPYVNVQYTQGRRKFSVLDLTLSRNISPYINAAAFYRKRLCVGPYENANTDNLNLAYTMRARSRDNRYHAAMGLVFDELKDNINGGLYQAAFDSLFFAKGGDLTTLEDAKLYRRHRALQARQLFRFFSDTVSSPHHLIAFHTLGVDELRNLYTDAFSTSDVTDNQLYPVYPTMTTGTVVDEKWSSTQWKSSQGLSYHTGGDTLGLRALAAADYGQQTFRDRHYYYSPPGEQLQQQNAGARAEASVNWLQSFTAGSATADARITRNSLFSSPESWLRGGFSIGLLGERLDHIDTIPADVWNTRDTVVTTTTHRPLVAEATVMHHSRNPSLYNTFYQPALENAFSPAAYLLNERYTHWRAGITARGHELRKGELLLPYSYFSLTIFSTQINQMVWHDEAMRIYQAPYGQVLKRSGFEQRARVRLGSFTLENRLIVTGTSKADTTTRVWQDNHLAVPRSSGFVGLFYEKHGIKVANAVRAGAEIHFQSAYHGKLFDPVSQQFYTQTDYLMPSNARVDFYAALHIKKAYVYVKVLNALEGAGGQLGYFTTPFYPMPERAFQFGVNWSFYD